MGFTIIMELDLYFFLIVLHLLARFIIFFIHCIYYLLCSTQAIIFTFLFSRFFRFCRNVFKKLFGIFGKKCCNFFVNRYNRIINLSIYHLSSIISIGIFYYSKFSVLHFLHFFFS